MKIAASAAAAIAAEGPWPWAPLDGRLPFVFESTVSVGATLTVAARVPVVMSLRPETLLRPETRAVVRPPEVLAANTCDCTADDEILDSAGTVMVATTLTEPASRTTVTIDAVTPFPASVTIVEMQDSSNAAFTVRLLFNASRLMPVTVNVSEMVNPCAASVVVVAPPAIMVVVTAEAFPVVLAVVAARVVVAAGAAVVVAVDVVAFDAFWATAVLKAKAMATK